MKKLFYEIEEFLKEKVEKIESEILALTDDEIAFIESMIRPME